MSNVRKVGKNIKHVTFRELSWSFYQNLYQIHLPSFLATAESFFSSTRPKPMSSSSRSSRTWAASCDKQEEKKLKRETMRYLRNRGWFFLDARPQGPSHTRTSNLFTPTTTEVCHISEPQKLWIAALHFLNWRETEANNRQSTELQQDQRGQQRSQKNKSDRTWAKICWGLQEVGWRKAHNS